MRNKLRPLLFFAGTITALLLVTPCSFSAFSVKEYMPDKTRHEDEFEELVAEYTRSLKVNPEDPVAYNDRGVVYQKMGKFSLAAEDYLNAIRLDSDGDIGRLAYNNLYELNMGLKNINKYLPQQRFGELFKRGRGYFDEAVSLYKERAFNQAKKYLELALTTFTLARMYEPDNKNVQGLVYLTKGFMHHITGIQYIQAIKSTDTNYTVLAYLRKAYYPLAFADAYYKASLEYLTGRDSKSFVKGYRIANDTCIKVAKKYLSRVDYWSRSYMKRTKKDVEFAVGIDRLNGLLAAGDCEMAEEIVLKLDSRLADLQRAESENIIGFKFLSLAYARLIGFFPYIEKADEMSAKKRQMMRNLLQECMRDLERAKNGFKLAALVNLCDCLKDYLMNIMERID